ncbi:MAG TPA: hypothetical protein VGR51_08955, partial [Thermoplasmata archaeon]|nr:hypothetical protein [Thermoplasmata archaeon]
MAEREDGAAKRGALERRRRAARVRRGVAAFTIGCLAGASLAHGLAALIAARDSGVELDQIPPAVLAVEPDPGGFLASGPASFTVAFDESLAGGPSVLLAGVTNLTATDASFDGRTWRATFEIPEGAD